MNKSYGFLKHDDKNELKNSPAFASAKSDEENTAFGSLAEKRSLIAEVNEQIPLLAYGLTEEIYKRGLRSKVSVRGVMGEEWGIGVSKNNPQKDLPNIIIYPKSIFMNERSVINARLRHEIGNLNYALGKNLIALQEWCRQKQINYNLLLPLVEAVQEASVNYLEMQNSFSEKPESAFLPLYDREINIKKKADEISMQQPYKQAVDLTLIKGLFAVGLADGSVCRLAEDNADENVRAVFTPRVESVIRQAIKTSSGRIKIQLIQNYLWPEFAGLLAGNAADYFNYALDNDEDNDSFNKSFNSQKQKQNRMDDSIDRLQKAIDALKKQQADKNAVEEQRNKAVDELLEEFKNALQDSADPETAEDLRKIFDSEKTSDNEEIENLQYKIYEVGIERQELSEVGLDLLERIVEFCREITEKYVKVMRFLMQNYQRRNPKFTDKIIEKMIAKHHDTPVFHIYGKAAGNSFLRERAEELTGGKSEIHSFLLSINIPPLLARFGYNDGKGTSSSAVDNGAVDWEHFYRSAMPIIWASIDCAVDDDLLLNLVSPPECHNWKDYFYLYEVLNFPTDDFLTSPEDSVDVSNRADQSDEEDSDESDEKNENEAESSSSAEQNGDGMENPFDSSNPSESTGNNADSDGQISSYGSNAGEGETQSNVTSPMTAENNSIDLQDSIPEAAESSVHDWAEETAELEKALRETLDELREQLEQDKTEDIREKLTEALKKILDEKAKRDGKKTADGTIGEKKPDENADNSEVSQNPLLQKEQDKPTPQTERGGFSNRRKINQLFKQLAAGYEEIKSHFEDDDGMPLELQLLDIDDDEILDNSIDTAEQGENLAANVDYLKAVKDEQSRQLAAFYTEQSGLCGETLNRYIQYREETEDLVEDLVEFFVQKFSLDVDFDYSRNQRHGNRLQNDWMHKLIGLKNNNIMIAPTIFERRIMPKNTQFVWSVIIDNSASCSGEIIKEEKKAALALVEVAKRLRIPLEILVFGDKDNYTFLKTFDMELYGEHLAAIINLDADNGTPDVVTLEAACTSISNYVLQFNRSCNFVYFMTDGKSGSGSIQSVIRKFRRETVITGIGLAEAAESIKVTWGSNGIGVKNIKDLSSTLIRKIEYQIEDVLD